MRKRTEEKSDNLSDWYTDVILKSKLADYGPVKGTMVLRPYGYALWEMVTESLNKMFKSAGVENAYFPMFIPLSLLEKEKNMSKGFRRNLQS